MRSVSQSTHFKSESGFIGTGSRTGSALLLTLLVVSLLLVIVLGFSVYVRMELRQVVNYQQQANARANARLGMELALARLQETAGPDTRVTATASILDQDPATTIPDGLVHPYWTGVWRKQDPDSRIHDPEFIGWLTSLPSGKLDLLTSSEQALDPSQTISLVGKGSVLRTDEYVWAEKIEIPDSGNGGALEGSYAFLVLDEGVKASLGLEDPGRDLTGVAGYRSQILAQRQSPEILNGFSALQSGEPVIREKADQIAGLPSRESLSLVDASFKAGQQENFHDATLHTYGVLSDTAKGGLKTDLTLAFEMSDSEFEALAGFHDSGEENRNLDGSWSQGFDLGYLYALEGESGSDSRPQSESNPEAADWSSGALKIRGPTWDLLRNYYLLYKDRSGLPVAGGLRASAPGPDRFDGVTRQESPVLSYTSTKQADVRNRDQFSGLYVFGSLNQTGNVMRLTESGLTPVVTRVMYVFSLAREGGNLVLVMNNIVVLHNPYDVPIEFRGFKFSPIGLPISRLQIRRRDDASDPSSTLGDLDKDISSVNDWLRVLTGKSNPWTYVNYIFTEDGSDTPADRMLMQPGEVIAFSNTDDPLLYASQTVGKVGLASGPEYEVDSGLYFDKFGESSSGSGGNKVESIAMDDSSRVWVEIELSGGDWGNYLFLPPDNLDASSDSWDRSHNSDALIGRLDIPVGELTSGGRTLGSLTGDYYTGAELGSSLQERVPLFVMDARLKPLSGDAAVLNSYNPRAMITQDRFMNGEAANWEARLYEINSFNEIDLDLDVFSGRNNGYWGPSLKAASGLTHFPLFQVPRGPLMSLASFAHVEIGNFPHDPPYAVGNSYAHPLIDREKVYNYGGSGNTGHGIVDQSFLSNESLWDGYFFSSLFARDDLGWSLDRTAEGFRDGEESLPNRNLLFHAGEGDASAQLNDLLDPDLVAAHLLNQGAFNVNSTSVPAWSAVLSGLRLRDITLADGSTESIQGSFFSRLEYPVSGSSDLYNKFRELSDAQIESLAAEIVQEVKTRGPYLSLADFVNRRLDAGDTGLSGALQAAIDRAGINNDFPNLSPADGSLSYPANQVEKSSAGAPGYLMQSDILRLIGARVTPRSDTFLVRAYGEASARNSTTTSIGVWCEATVQRMPEEMSSNAFGRKFKILSFRYLHPDEI